MYIKCTKNQLNQNSILDTLQFQVTLLIGACCKEKPKQFNRFSCGNTLNTFPATGISSILLWLLQDDFTRQLGASGRENVNVATAACGQNAT